MKSIKIVCLNAAVDHSIDVGKFELGGVMRASRNSFFASGKGGNTASAIARLNFGATLYSIVGANEANIFREMHPLISTQLEEIPEPTRENVTITEQEKTLICHLQTAGPTVTQLTVSNLIARVADDANKQDVFVISGSMPRGVESEDLEGLVSCLRENEVKLILDIDPMYWAGFDLSKVDLVKPNIEEWGRFIGRKFSNIREAVISGLPDEGPRNVLLSAGSQGAVLLSRDVSGFIRGWTHVETPVQGNTIGCGDAMVGGIAIAFAKELDGVELLRYGTALGYANLFAPGPGRIDPTDFARGVEQFRSSLSLLD